MSEHKQCGCVLDGDTYTWRCIPHAMELAHTSIGSRATCSGCEYCKKKASKR